MTSTLNFPLFNMGLPMIIPALYLMIPGLIPIVLIESLVIARRMGWSFRSSFGKVASANIASTLLGIPVTWFLLAAAGMETAMLFQNVPTNSSAQSVFLITLGSAWIPPLPRDAEWVIFPAMGFLLVIFFFASWAIEYLIVKGMAARKDDGGEVMVAGPKLRGAVRDANLFSYILLELVVVGFYLFSPTL
jgi:hypothetical protein